MQPLCLYGDQGSVTGSVALFLVGSHLTHGLLQLFVVKGKLGIDITVYLNKECDRVGL